MTALTRRGTADDGTIQGRALFVLSHPVRRYLLERAARGPVGSDEVLREFPYLSPASLARMASDLQVLGLLRCSFQRQRGTAQHNVYELNDPTMLRELRRWLDHLLEGHDEHE